MNPNLNRSEAYLRTGKRMYSPVHPQWIGKPHGFEPDGCESAQLDSKAGRRDLEKEYDSINAAKRRSRELMKSGNVIVTKES